MMRSVLVRALTVVVVTLLGVGAALAVRDEGVPTIDAVASPTLELVRDWACPPGAVGRVSCAFVSVPLDPNDPDFDTLDLFTARLTPPLPSTEPPLLYIGDGLGDDVVGDFDQWQRVARELGRDVVLVDLRNAGRSEPGIRCDGIRRVQWLEARLDSVRSDASTQRATELRRCFDRMTEVLPIELYSIDTIAADLEAVRDHLGIDTWVVAASGDATHVAQTLARQSPASVTSLVLLAASGSDTARHQLRQQYASEVYEAAFTDVERSAIDQTIEELVGQSVVFAARGTGSTQRVRIGPESLVPVLALAAGASAESGTLPILSASAASSDRLRAIAVLRAEQYNAATVPTIGTTMAMVCAQAGYPEAPPLADAVPAATPEWLGLLDDPTLDPANCADWPVDAAAAMDAPTVPVLVVNGEFDVSAPASAALEIESNWSTASVRVLADRGRPTMSDSCVLQTIAAHLSGATDKVDGPC